ncbi:MAG TPA: Rne/Rng family ribonuclease, partial [Thermoanaerobaculia bacterium]|nr:Rne/Rng family ribonuclease [Thermoanaerobaculia bacterium]
MTRRMLINAQNAEELRIAIVDGKTLENYQVEVADRNLTRGNIYRASVVNIQPSLNAAFLDYGAERHGFLAIQDVVPAVYRHEVKGERARIDKVLDRGQSVMIQVVKEPEGQKGAAVTTNLSLAGRYLVFTPYDDMRGVSRKVEDEESRRRLKEIASGLSIPQGGGVIIRTNAIDQNKTTLARDLAELLRLWRRIKGEGGRGKGAKLLYSDQDLILRALRDYLDNSIDEVLVDDDEALNKARQYLRAVMPRTKMRIERYSERAPLFARFDLDSQIERIYERRVELPSGGSLVIDRTEALTAIDVNSGKATRASSQEETAVNTNVEAAEEVARQLRLRDLGGLIVVDFIDMRSGKNRRKVEKTLRDAMKIDKARSSVGRISANGLLEVNRQKIQ